MKIDIGKGKILGTKEVSPNGQISGFTEYAGRDVLVVLPEDDTNIEADPREVMEELKLATQQHMKVAFEEYEQLKDRFQGPSDATRRFMEDNAPRSFQGLYDKVETWLQDQATQAEDRVKDAIEYDDDTQPPEGPEDVPPAREPASTPSVAPSRASRSNQADEQEASP